MERIKMYLPKIAIGIGIFGLGVICGGYMIFGFETAIVMAISYLIGLIIGMLTIK
nr:MAG TPA: hypothetical protein [Caudoviricetes sp.]